LRRGADREDVAVRGGFAPVISTRRYAQLGLVAAGVVLASSLGVLFAFSPKHEPIVVAPTGDAIPAFHLKDLDGRSYSSTDLHGKAVVIFFSSVRCTTCGDYQNRVADLARQYDGNPRVQFLALNQDLSDGDQQRLLEVRVFSKVSNRPFPTLLDTGGRTAARFGAKAAQFAVIDATGAVRYIGGFDDNRDAAKVTRHYVAEQLRQVVEEIPTAVASR
jgi:peroxiredoxin